MGTGKLPVGSVILCVCCVGVTVLITRTVRIRLSAVPPKSSPATNDTTDFVKVFSINATYPITKYVSRQTGLEIVHAEVQGPLLHGYIALATKAENDDGLPHSLEHLIFHGSTSYPYSGTLNVLAGKCLSPGLNAYTEQTHTVFQLDTAGYEGFLTLLPIYLDHIFYPILSNESFTTEIYHVTGEGIDAGVMYSEMKGWEFNNDKRLSIPVQQTLYPINSGYRYEAGGLSKNLRESTNNTKVKQFHAKFYNPRNMRIIVTGVIEPKSMFQALDPVVKKLVETGAANVNWRRPWLEEVPQVSFPSTNNTIYFPSDEETHVSVAVAFRVRSTIEDFDGFMAMDTLLGYLLLGNLAPLKKSFVEIEEPLASRIGYSYREYSSNHAYFEFEGVDKDKMSSIRMHLRASLESQLDDFDMSRMTNTIEKKIAIHEGRDESNPEYFISNAVIKDFLFGDNSRDLFEKRVSLTPTLRTLLSKPKDFWVNLLEDGILNKRWTTIYSVPSIAYQHNITAEEEGRVVKRREMLGESGLNELAKKLDEAVKANSVKIPDSILEKINVPSTESIYYHSIVRQKNPEWAGDFKAKLFVNDIKASFVDVHVLMNTATLNTEHRKYLQLFQRYLAQSPILDDDDRTKIIPFEEISSTRTADILRLSTKLGMGTMGFTEFGRYSHLLVLEMRLAMEKVDKGMDWIRKLLWKSVWVENKIKAAINKDVRALVRRKEMGVTIQKVLLQNILYKPASNVAENLFIRQLTFLGALAKTRPINIKNVTDAFDAIRNVITSPGNMVVHISTNLTKLNSTLAETTETKSIAALLNRTFPFAENTTAFRRLANEPDKVWMRPEQELRSKPGEVILGLPTVESSYLSMVAPGPDSFSHPDLPALLVTIQYFNQHGGPFWTSVRGGGFAYTVFCYSSVTEGIIYFELEQCSDVVGAYGAAQASVEESPTGNRTLWSEELLKSAKSSLIYENVLKEKTPSELGRASLESYYRNATEIYTHELVKMIPQVELRDIRSMTKKYLKPLFNQQYACVVVCPLDKRDDIVKGLNRFGRKLQIMPPMQWENNLFVLH